MNSRPRIALLSTGDEIINGDILNTNSQILAQQLFAQDIQPGLQLTASDSQAEIEQAMRFLLKDHAALIITGGLGPTSDDRTRFALEQVLQTSLVFDETCWQYVVERLQRLSLPVPDTNRQQCLFPHGAVILPNANGTAAGCQVMHGQQPIFMLPGPPHECMPIFTAKVLPYLQTHGFAQPLFRHEWLLLSVSEGGIAEQLDPLVENSECYVGYRVNQPYLEVKLQSADPTALEKLQIEFEAIIGPYSVSSCKQKASTQLIQWILANRPQLSIDDQATGGWLAAHLLTPETYPYLHFTPTPQAIHIQLSGLNSYWLNQSAPKSDLQLEIVSPGTHYQTTLAIPFRKERTLLYAGEMACWEILNGRLA